LLTLDVLVVIITAVISIKTLYHKMNVRALGHIRRLCVKENLTL